MEKVEIGGKITLPENKKYIIVDILEDSDKKYLLCSTMKDKIEPVVFEYKYIDNKLKVRREIDKKIVEEILKKVLDSQNR